MENKIAVFNNEEFGAVRTISENGKILFCAKDVAVALGYSNPRKAVADHCKGVTKRDTLTEGGVQLLSYIPEGDVYRLIVSSKLPSAARIETWLFDTVVPDIRRHGAYISDPLMQKMADNPGLLEKIVETMMYERKRADSLSEKLNEAQPKADYFDSFVNPANCTNIRDTAKELGVPEKTFCKFLQNEKYLYRCPAGNLMPYSKKSNDGLFVVRDYYRRGHFGTYTLITPSGKNLFRMLFGGMGM